MTELDQIRQELAEVAAMHAEADAAAQPTASRWWFADGALRALHARRAGGAIVPSSAILAACDARLEAGHAHHPFKTRVQELERWLKALQAERDRLLLKQKPRET